MFMSTRTEERYKEARARKAERNTLSPQQQIARLDFRLGKGDGAAKERLRLAKIIEAQKVRKTKASA